MPVSLELCGNIVPTLGSGNIEFSWNGAPASTTQYAVRLGKTPAGASDPTILVEGVQAEASVATGERVAGTAYRVDIYALQDRTPLCVLSGMNVVTPQ